LFTPVHLPTIAAFPNSLLSLDAVPARTTTNQQTETRLFTTRSVRRALGALALATAPCMPALAQDVVTLKVHHFLPAGSYANQQFIQPWCDKIAKDSGGKLKCQIYPPAASR
jgi:hypothetical protein